MSNQLFWCEQKGTRALTHTQVTIHLSAGPFRRSLMKLRSLLAPTKTQPTTHSKDGSLSLSLPLL